MTLNPKLSPVQCVIVTLLIISLLFAYIEYSLFMSRYSRYSELKATLGDAAARESDFYLHWSDCTNDSCEFKATKVYVRNLVNNLPMEKVDPEGAVYQHRNACSARDEYNFKIARLPDDRPQFTIFRTEVRLNETKDRVLLYWNPSVSRACFQFQHNRG